MRRFVGIDLGREPVPDETTVCRFRHLLEEHELGRRLFEGVATDQNTDSGNRSSISRQRPHPLLAIRKPVRTRSVQFPSHAGFEGSERRNIRLRIQRDAEQTGNADRVRRVRQLKEQSSGRAELSRRVHGRTSVRRGWTEQKVVVAPADGSRDTPFEIKLPKPEGVSNIRRMVWAADNSSLIIDRVDKDTKRRQLFYIYNVGSKGEKIIPITEETDEKWQASLSSIFEPNPKDPSELFFGSEKDGFNHLYLAKLETEATSRKPNPQPASDPAGESERSGILGQGDDHSADERKLAGRMGEMDRTETRSFIID